IYKIIRRSSEFVPLSSESKFNCVSYSTVKKIIEASLNKALTGTFNLVSDSTVNLKKVADLAANSNIKFGRLTYSAPKVSNQKAREWEPELKYSSEEILKKYGLN